MTQQIISIHAPKAQRPQTMNEFGYFLAGLIDGNGHIHQDGSVTLTLHEKDASVAYYIKKTIGYGKVKHVEKPQMSNVYTYVYVCTHLSGIKVIGDTLHDKLINPDVISQFNKYLAPSFDLPHTASSEDSSQNYGFDNRWLAGFMQAQVINNPFVIQIFDPLAFDLEGKGAKKKKYARVLSKDSTQQVEQLNLENMQIQMGVRIHHKTDFLLKLIKNTVGGQVCWSEEKNSFLYDSKYLKNTIKFIKYLDRYQVMGACLTGYWLWRKAYLRLQSGAYKTEKGYSEIFGFKTRLCKLRSYKN